MKQIGRHLASSGGAFVLLAQALVACSSDTGPTGTAGSSGMSSSGTGGNPGSGGEATGDGGGNADDGSTGGANGDDSSTGSGTGGSSLSDAGFAGAGGEPSYDAAADVVVSGGACNGGTCTLNNGVIEVTYTESSGNITAKNLGSGVTFIKSGSLSETGGTASIVNGVAEYNFHGGQAVEVPFANGDKDRIIVFPGSGFAYFKKWFGNKTSADRPVIDKVQQVKLTLGTAVPAAELKAQGTAGLTTVSGNPGSYAYLAVADPATRHGVVGGFTTDLISTGVVFSAVAGTDATMTAQSEFGKLRVKPGQSREGEMFEVGYFDDARLGLEAHAGDIAIANAIHMKPNRVLFCTWQAKGPLGTGGAGTESQGATTTAWLKQNLNAYGFHTYQIDDGWQLSKRNFSDYNHSGPYSSGMKQFADVVKSNGLHAGLWFLPFAQEQANAPALPAAWQLHADGGAIETSGWAGQSMDMTLQPVKDYIKKVADLVGNQWGYDYFKIDGMFTGIAGHQNYINDGYKTDDFFFKANLSDPYQTNVEAYRNAWKIIRDTAPASTFIMGCTISQNMRTMAAGYGILDAERIGPDNQSDWGNMMKGILRGGQRYFYNGRVFWNDPDPVYVRNSQVENQTVCGYDAITGFLYTSAENYSTIPAANIDVLKRTMPYHGSLNVRPADFFDRDNPGIWLLTDDTKGVRRDVIGLFNFDAANPMTDKGYSLAKLGLSSTTTYVGFDFWANKFVAPFSGTIPINLAPTASQIIAVRAVSGHPMVVSTNRHVSQGIYDIVSENWDAGSKTLSGTSHVVGNDPYELRIYASNGSGNWTATMASVSSADQGAGVTANPIAQTGAEIRVTFKSPGNRDVKWSVVFK